MTPKRGNTEEYQGNKNKMAYQEDQILSVSEAIARFLEEKKPFLSPYTHRDYAIDLNRFARTYDGPLQAITLSALEPFFASLASLKPSSQARKLTALSRFLSWAQERQLIHQNPMTSLPPFRPRRTLPPSFAPADMYRLLQAIPPTQLRDRLIFRLIGEQGLRTTEVLALQVEDLELTNEGIRIRVQSKGTKMKTPRLAIPDLAREISHYLYETGYRTGPLFRAQKGKREEPLTSKSLYVAWKTYSSAANVSLSLHELRRSAILSAFQHHEEIERIGLQYASHIESSYLKRYLYEQKDFQSFHRQLKKEESSAEADGGHSYWYLVRSYLDINAIITGTAASGTSWRYTEVAEGYCTYPFYAECPHRLVCAHCSYYVSTEEETQPSQFERDQYTLQLLQELKISAAEWAVTRNKQGAAQRLREALVDIPTPAGPTPRQLQQVTDRLKENPILSEQEEQTTAH